MTKSYYKSYVYLTIFFNNFGYLHLVGNIYMHYPSGQSGLSDHCYKFWMYPLPSTKFSILVSHICESSLPPAIFHVDILLLILEICNIFPEKFLHLHHTWFIYIMYFLYYSATIKMWFTWFICKHDLGYE